ncbi:MAG: hypothetical protein K9M07_07575 [Simkaniaceae bacterium]|nr:hypothetical protein [Simkaniaceae bacterium]MCF7853082.1 hypothetical protein [Simkaniaceae bacterium]
MRVAGTVRVFETVETIRTIRTEVTERTPLRPPSPEPVYVAIRPYVPYEPSVKARPYVPPRETTFCERRCNDIQSCADNTSSALRSRCCVLTMFVLSGAGILAGLATRILGTNRENSCAPCEPNPYSGITECSTCHDATQDFLNDAPTYFWSAAGILGGLPIVGKIVDTCWNGRCSDN